MAILRMLMTNLVIILCVSFNICQCIVSPRSGSITFASYYGDHMVLQHAPKRAILWGYASVDAVGEKVLATVGDIASAHGTIQPRGKDMAVWSVMLPPVSGPGPYTIRVNTTFGAIYLRDVLFGDVYICSGQSNMFFPVSMLRNSTAEMNDVVNYPNIRVFTVGRFYSSKPQIDPIEIAQRWSVPTKYSIGHDRKYFSAVCWLYAKYMYHHLRYPIGLISSAWGGTPIEAWSSPDDLNKCGIPDSSQPYTLPRGPTDHSQLWNAMIHPFLNMTIYGVLWYQGEANAKFPDSYRCTFPAMISDWREKFQSGSRGQTDAIFPFGFVQLSANQDFDIVKGFADIRWHQTADFGFVPNALMPRTFMAVAMDLPDFHSPWSAIHPRTKHDVSWRLMLSGLSVAYSRQDIKFQGPMVSAFYIDIGNFTLDMDFDNRTSPIEIRNTQGFEVCCSTNNQSYCSDVDTRWKAAPIIDHDNYTVTLSYKICDDVSNISIVGLRYAWRESPCPFKRCAVYSQENELPAPPFVTNGLIGLNLNTWEDIVLSSKLHSKLNLEVTKSHGNRMGKTYTQLVGHCLVYLIIALYL